MNNRAYIEWEPPEDNWNITSVPRSVEPHVILKNHQHNLPPATNFKVIETDEDEQILRRLQEFKVNCFFF
jgi:hypothetical protein